ncbi:TonB-dependent siderophore receptor [Croceicoccus sp. YJ47]|uniref:TonB-dependent siderophore receptor n=1 Tax=Croceicoccus sp. YJ47 TaxID=2798724 RepID=UPI001922E8F2|nr:TonB-dependent receptor [Croceicoccus sp. YJ47]QQN74730.1 TonB-dependent receptor [Croceicoccus sp. YJ47]
MPLSEALQRIADEWNAPMDIDPAATEGLTAKPVVDARSERDAVDQATRGLPVAVQISDDGRIAIINELVVIARLNEAEDNVLVRGATSSSRLGQSLREQPRNTQVISSKLLERQQAQTLTEALANAGGVVANTATVQGGVSFSVRGFDSNGAVNGLPSASSSTFAAGTTLPLANIERIEVLKGPDAILLGSDNLGGTINIVTKKPYAEERLHVTAETGSFGLARGTIDANQSLTRDDRLSARVIATAATADRNFGGYRGNEDYLFAPSVRYKNAKSDIIVSATLGNQLFGVVPFTVMNRVTGEPYDIPDGQPLIGGKDQGVQIETTQFNAEISQEITDWLSVVARGQHQTINFALRQYSPFAILDNNGLLLVSSSGTRQTSENDTVDAFGRISFDTGAVSHKIVAGMTVVDSKVRAIYAGDGGLFPYNFLNPPATLRPLARNYNLSFDLDSTQYGYYGQYLIGFGPVHLVAGVRHNNTTITSAVSGGTPVENETNATTPNYGAVVDLTDHFSLFGSLAFGYVPVTTLDRSGNTLPDIRSRNAEIGVKWDLFDERVLLNASWFNIRQTNLLDRDPVDPRFQISVPGQQGEGIDINVSGRPFRGLTVSAAYTRTNYKFLEPSNTLGNTVNGQPRDVYNVYASYERKIADRMKAGIGASVSGRSSSAIDRLDLYRIPAATFANLNGFLSIGDLDINVGVRNLFDAENFNPTRSINYVPLGEPRTWRLTVGYRFF